MGASLVQDFPSISISNTEEECYQIRKKEGVASKVSLGFTKAKIF